MQYEQKLFHTDMHKATMRGTYLLGAFALVATILISGTIYVGSTSGELYSRVIGPLGQAFIGVVNAFEKAMSSSSTSGRNSRIETTVTTNSESKIEIQINNNLSSPSGTTNRGTYYYSYPTSTPRPTPKSGEPGSPEWDAEFQRDWEEMTRQNAESRKKFCEQFPQECN